MPDVTYTAQGTFNREGKAIINVCIPAESKPHLYVTEICNLSKITRNGRINAIFCYFNNNSTVPIQHDSFDYRIFIDTYAMKSFPGAVDFDESGDDALFIFFHNDEVEKSDRDYYFRELETIYDLVKNNGNQSQAETQTSSTTATLSNPRRVGLSLVSKLGN